MADLDTLRAFVLAVEQRGLAPAGRHLGVPASTVGRAIDRLEERVGVTLLHRSTRGVSPTELGRLYYEGLREVLSTLADLEERVRGLATDVGGRLRVTLPSVQDTPALLEQCIAAFAQGHPALRVDSYATNRHVDLVGEGFDVALRAGPIADESLRARRLFDVEWRLFASPSYLDSAGTIEAVDDLRARRCLAFGEGEGPLRWPLCGGGSFELEPAMRSNDMGLLKRSVLASGGVAFLPRAFLHRAVLDARVVEVLPERVARSESFYVVHPLARPVPSKVRAFVDFAVAFFEAIEMP